MAKTASFGSMLSLEKQKSRSSHERAKQALYDAYVESERSLDEILDLIRNADEWI